MKKLTIILVLCTIAYLFRPTTPMRAAIHQSYSFWEMQSIDTMKFSRDVAREKSNDPSFDIFIDKTVKDIAATGATHVALGTPYDPEFTPFLTRWVNAARKYKLNVWFRGNMAGWEGWFDYIKIDRTQHLKGILSFIDINKNLFQDGDIFTSCPECENGGPGDPRFNNDVEGHRNFLILEYTEVNKAFKKINKQVRANTFSMNGDVTKLIMNPETTKKLDGVVVPDHYVKTPEQTLVDLKNYAQKSGGDIVLGEFGIPIPDIHGAYSETEQSEWLESFFKGALDHPEVIGFNYWTNIGGSTQLWNGDGTPRQAVDTITKYFSPEVRRLHVDNTFGRRIKRLSINHSNNVKTVKEKDGSTVFVFLPGNDEVTIVADEYNPIKVKLSDLPMDESNITLELVANDFFSRLRAFFKL